VARSLSVTAVRIATVPGQFTQASAHQGAYGRRGQAAAGIARRNA
jgi:hypothetical protein